MKPTLKEYERHTLDKEYHRRWCRDFHCLPAECDGSECDE